MTWATAPAWLQTVQNFGNLSNTGDLWNQIQHYGGGTGVDHGIAGSWNYQGYTIAPELTYGTGEDSGSSTLQGYTVAPTGASDPGQYYALFNPDGSYNGSSTYNADATKSNFLNFLAAAGGIAALGPMMAGEAAAGAGAGAGSAGFAGDATAAGYDPLYGASTGAGGLTGDATAAGYAGLDADSASTLGGGATINGGAALGTGVVPGVGSTFNAAQDSQLANEQLGLGPVTDSTPPAIPVNGPTGVVPGSGGTTPTGTPTPTGGGTTTPIPGTGTGTGSGSGSGSGFDWSRLLGLIPGLIDQNNQSNSSDQLLAWLQSQQSKIDNLYTPNSPEYNYLWDQMSRTDAAAGRNSQYGPRSVDLAAKIAQIKADDTTKLTSGIAPYMAFGINQGNNSNSGLIAAIAALAGSGSGTSGGSYINQLINSLTGSSSSGSGSTTTNVPGSSNYNDPTGLPSGSDLGGDPFAY